MLASLGALDGLGDMRSIINTSKYFKVLQPSFEMVNMVNEWLLVALVTATSKVDGIGPKEPAHAVSPNGGHQ